MSRPIWQRFESVLADPITRYLAAKRSMGCRFNTEDRQLRVLDRYLTEQGVQCIGDVTSACLEAFLASRRRACGVSYNDLLGVVRRLLEWMIDQQELTTSPLTTQPQPHSARRLPYLYDPATIRRILDYAAELPDNNRAPQRGPTYAWGCVSARSLAFSAAMSICSARCSLCATASSVRAASFRLARASLLGCAPTLHFVNSAWDSPSPRHRSLPGTDDPRL